MKKIEFDFVLYETLQTEANKIEYLTDYFFMFIDESLNNENLIAEEAEDLYFKTVTKLFDNYKAVDGQSNFEYERLKRELSHYDKAKEKSKPITQEIVNEYEGYKEDLKQPKFYHSTIYSLYKFWQPIGVGIKDYDKRKIGYKVFLNIKKQLLDFKIVDEKNPSKINTKITNVQAIGYLFSELINKGLIEPKYKNVRRSPLNTARMILEHFHFSDLDKQPSEEVMRKALFDDNSLSKDKTQYFKLPFLKQMNEK